MGFGLFNVGLRVLKKYSTEFFYATEPLGQYCRGFFPVQFSSKNINAILNRTVSSEKLSKASWTILHMAFFLYNTLPRVLIQF